MERLEDNYSVELNKIISKINGLKNEGGAI